MFSYTHTHLMVYLTITIIYVYLKRWNNHQEYLYHEGSYFKVYTLCLALRVCLFTISQLTAKLASD